MGARRAERGHYLRRVALGASAGTKGRAGLRTLRAKDTEGRNVASAQRPISRRSCLSSSVCAFWPTALSVIGAGPSRAIFSTGSRTVTGRHGNGTVSGFGGLTGRLYRRASSAPPIAAAASTPDGQGYWLIASGGGYLLLVTPSSTALPAGPADKPIVGMATTPDGHGYWLVASDGGIFAYGDAHFYGSTGGDHLSEPIVAMASTPDGQWLLAGGL